MSETLQSGSAGQAGEVYPGVMVDPLVAHGQPVLMGTRVPVSVVLGHLAAGDTLETVSAEYELTPEQVRAAFGYAANIMQVS